MLATIICNYIIYKCVINSNSNNSNWRKSSSFAVIGGEQLFAIRIKCGGSSLIGVKYSKSSRNTVPSLRSTKTLLMDISQSANPIECNSWTALLIWLRTTLLVTVPSAIAFVRRCPILVTLIIRFFISITSPHSTYRHRYVYHFNTLQLYFCHLGPFHFFYQTLVGPSNMMIVSSFYSDIWNQVKRSIRSTNGMQITKAVSKLLHWQALSFFTMFTNKQRSN